MIRRTSCAAAAAATACCLAPAAAHAGAGISMAAVGQPSYFELTAAPGHAVRAEVRLTNLTNAPKRVRLDPIDVGVAQAGGLAYALGRAKDVGRWLRPDARTVTLAPHEARTVGLTVRVPRRAVGGDHYAALAASVDGGATTAKAGRRSVALRFVARLAIAVRVRLPGALRPVLRAGRAHVTLRGIPDLVLPMANTGTTLLDRAQLTFSVRRGGRRLFGVRQPLGAFVPGGRLAYTTRWPVRLAYGRYRLDGTLTAGGKTMHLRQRFAIAPPGARRTSALTVDGQPLERVTRLSPLMLAVMAAMVVGALGGAALRRRTG